MKGKRRPRLEEMEELTHLCPERVPLTNMIMDLTHRCNFLCKGCIERAAMCWSRWSDLAPGTACGLVRQFRARGGRSLGLYGGEPTLAPAFGPVVAEAARCGISSLRVVTNGSLLQEPRVLGPILAAVHDINLTVRVSLNASSPETHAALHRAAGYFRAVVRGMAALGKGHSRVRLGVSFLLQEDNATEIRQAASLAADVGAKDFYVRPETGPHGIGPVQLSPPARQAALEAMTDLANERLGGLAVHVAPWHYEFLKTGTVPDTSKPYCRCYYGGACRIVVTPPEPGVAWACPYRRGDKRFHICDLIEDPLGTPEFERHRVAAIRRVSPSRDCQSVVCNRREANLFIWARRMAGMPDRPQPWTSDSPARTHSHTQERLRDSK